MPAPKNLWLNVKLPCLGDDNFNWLPDNSVIHNYYENSLKNLKPLFIAAIAISFNVNAAYVTTLSGSLGDYKTTILNQTEIDNQVHEVESVPGLYTDPIVAYMNKDELLKQIKNTQKNMEKAAKELDFIEAAKFRDELDAFKNMLK